MLTRRQLGRLALVTPAAAAFGLSRVRAQVARPDSKIEGVQIGLIVPYSLGRDAGDADAVLASVLAAGISAIEMQDSTAEGFAGAPALPGFRRPAPSAPPSAPSPSGTPPSGTPPSAPPAAGAVAPGAAPQRREVTPEQQAARRQAQDALRAWRVSQSMDRFKALRAKYNDAGVAIYAFKLALTAAMTDEEYEYAFAVAEALGASHLTMELPADGALTRRIGEFAARRQMMVGYHTHTQGSLTAFDEALAQSKYNGINVDIGHYVAGTSQSPIPLIRKHHSRFTSIHLKDRRKGNGPNMPWGQGDTPIAEVLQLMKAERYTWPATIELEYPVPDGSTRVAEIRKCLEYCRTALTSA